MADHAIFFHEYQEADQPIVGGKCASLGAMTQAGLPVPPGFAVTTHAFAESMGMDHAPPALGAPPEMVTEPFTIMLWGITSDSIQKWLGGVSADGGLSGFAASPKALRAF